ncbi:cationic amino acid transporter-like protein [Ectocarpus siliculosus]|uniref:Cationic amino acid transporter-like protein n=1 Tax=Ectocarpus siliculosus TaxID=2880 RepID=D8LQA2_ECTSI|nr:cationic amino acid transporter-like protein [Ectocarpus siliculosus]|eukprot:CBN77482.1 cationic amino acid transporter-like protein [Ectocarpus siliculosus]
MTNGRYNTLSQNTRTPSRRLPGLPGVPALIRKPLAVVLMEASNDPLVRHLTLFDLVVIGVAGTVGSGIFAIVGLIGSTYAGPAAVVSWVLAGIGCVFSGLSYAELSSIIPSEGGTYAYAFVALGELPAIVTAWCLTLEFGISGAAVARAWADKIVEWVTLGAKTESRWIWLLDPFPGLGISPLAGLLQAACVVVLLRGVEMSKRVTTVMTAIKMAVCIFIIVGGLALFDPGNMLPFAPMGVAGVIRGSSAAFFGYLGYDEVCALAGESINPRRDVPLAIAYTLAIVAATYVLSALALSGMVPVDGSAASSSFVLAFAARGWHWACQIVAVGELVSLPVVVLASFLVQPRLLFVLASDGLLPKSLASTDERGVLTTATTAAGGVMVAIATFAPFAVLDDLVSAGVLLCFAITNSCAIVIRRSNLDPIFPGPCRPLVLLFNALCLAGGLLVRVACAAADRVSLSVAATAAEGGNGGGGGGGGGSTAAEAAEATAATAAALAFLAAGLVALALSICCPELPHPLGGPEAFRGPFSPWVPAVGTAISWILLTQLSWASLRWTLWAVGAVSLWYFTYGLKHSVGQKSRTWPQLAAATAAAASNTSTGEESLLESPPSTPEFGSGKRMGGNHDRGAGGKRERSQLRATFPGEPPLDSVSPARGGSTGRLSGEEGEGLAVGAQKEEGYMSFAALT